MSFILPVYRIEAFFIIKDEASKSAKCKFLEKKECFGILLYFVRIQPIWNYIVCASFPVTLYRNN